MVESCAFVPGELLFCRNTVLAREMVSRTISPTSPHCTDMFINLRVADEYVFYNNLTRNSRLAKLYGTCYEL